MANPLPPSRRKLAIERYNSGQTVAQIAHELGIAYRTVQAWVRRDQPCGDGKRCTNFDVEVQIPGLSEPVTFRTGGVTKTQVKERACYKAQAWASYHQRIKGVLAKDCKAIALHPVEEKSNE